MLRTICRLRSPLSFLTPINPSSSSLTATRLEASQFSPFFSYFSSSPVLQGRQVNHNEDEFNRDPDGPPRLFVIQPRIRPETYLKAKLEEALNLANSLEQQRDGFYETEFLDKETPPHLVVQNPVARSPRADTYFGVGTVDNVKCHINNLESKDGVDAVFVNAILTGIQQRNLERAWGKPVLDRVGLIIEIFNAHAQTKEAKLQAELAALMYKRSRLVRVRGPDGRYTFGGIGEAEVVSARGLFATVDPKLSSVILPSGRKVLLSDTVGFISDLPVQLVEAFHATLEEVVEADLLVHVLDSSAPNIEEHRETVMQVLGRIGVSEEKLQNMIEVWNKVDLVQKEFDLGEIGDGGYASSFSGEEDAELTGQHDNDQDIEAEPSGDVKDAIYHEQFDDSDDWLSCEEEQDSWVDYDGLSIGCETLNGQQNEFSRDQGPAVKSSQSQSESNGHVKTSAVTGVGLQELLELIDEKLGPSHVVERSIFDRKWRPPRREDNNVAVEQ
ncbi:GTP-binding protein, chloroplastic [Sesamum angolense]|uniref:GTP-binding protein, chloroplastic n=1 Tax=Sesamum angolense TaxID=2727404 RepID=A0AAE1WHJ9_9LAMI|nr:GTP-binding protein, chloroplastic [Sesamum angolense]